MRCSDIKVIKKDGTREDFNVQKVVVAVNKSANRAMITFSRAEINFICQFVEEKAEQMDAQLYHQVAGLGSGFLQRELRVATVVSKPRFLGKQIAQYDAIMQL